FFFFFFFKKKEKKTSITLKGRKFKERKGTHGNTLVRVMDEEQCVQSGLYYCKPSCFPASEESHISMSDQDHTGECF
ncbi:hypothetical protein J4V79_25525, partial [Escherichia coli]